MRAQRAAPLTRAPSPAPPHPRPLTRAPLTYSEGVSNVEPTPHEAVGGGRTGVALAPVRQLLSGREVMLGPRGMLVTRTLPHRDRRMVGAWCFADQYGPEDIARGSGMRVPPHPHTGLQTVSWLVDGEVLHRDSLGNLQLVRPGQLNLMTGGHGISHSEESPPERSPILHGVQLWAALPDKHRHMDPHFEHHPSLPALPALAVPADKGVTVTVVMGELGGTASPARVYSPLVCAEVVIGGGCASRLPVRPDFEYAALALYGTAEVDGIALSPGPLAYLGCGRTELPVSAPLRSRILLLGGEPFGEQIVMWWNLVGRSHEEIVHAREDWMAGRRFGTVRGYDGDPLPAPPMPATPLRPRGQQSPQDPRGR
jgi:quercetin 2,3-dioxygenase